MFKNPDFSSLGLGSQTATSRDAWLAELKKETGKKRFFPVSVCRKSPAAAGLFLQAENALCILKGFDAV